MNLIVKTRDPKFNLREATIEDVPLILSFIQELAEYEKLTHEVVVSESDLEKSLFGDHRVAEVILGYYDDSPVAFALFFHNFSTFLGKRGIYLEDIFVRSEVRGKGLGKIMISYLAKIADERDCGRFEWSVLNWNKPAIEFYRSIGAEPMDEWTVQRLSGNALAQLAQKF